uniref:(northern house mosquito) hypothetical protein n=1 Tax=Culex pipiens TaxID=7175 RepID=A0A8D8FZN2_CULPI
MPEKSPLMDRCLSPGFIIPPVVLAPAPPFGLPPFSPVPVVFDEVSVDTWPNRLRRLSIVAVIFFYYSLVKNIQLNNRKTVFLNQLVMHLMTLLRVQLVPRFKIKHKLNLLLPQLNYS